MIEKTPETARNKLKHLIELKLVHSNSKSKTDPTKMYVLSEE